MFEIGVSVCGAKIDRELFDKYVTAGITHMEISVNKEECQRLDYKMVEKYSQETGVRLWSFHLPFYPFEEIDISNKLICDKSVDCLSELIKKAGDIGIEKYVIHASGEPIEDCDRNSRMETAKESLVKLAEVAHECGGVIAVEDLPRSCLGRNSSDISELISCDDRLMVCFDTNHLLGEDFGDFIRNVGKRIVTTHISDYDFVNERHWLPGEGKVDWQRLITELKGVGYTGPWLYEIGLNIPGNIIRDRALCYEDFVNNAKALFEGRTPDIFSRPKENLGMWD